MTTETPEDFAGREAFQILGVPEFFAGTLKVEEEALWSTAAAYLAHNPDAPPEQNAVLRAQVEALDDFLSAKRTTFKKAEKGYDQE